MSATDAKNHPVAPDTGSLHTAIATLERNSDQIARDAASIKEDAKAAREAAEAGKITAEQYARTAAELVEANAKLDSQRAVVEKLSARCDVLEKNQTRSSIIDEKEYVAEFSQRNGGLSRKQRESITQFGRWVEDRTRVEMEAKPRNFGPEMFKRGSGQDEGAPSGGVSKGGNLIMQQIFDEVQWLQDEYGTVLRDARVVRMTSPTLDIPTAANAWTLEYPGETNGPAAFAGSEIIDPKPRLDAKTAIAKSKISFELNQDMPIGFLDFMMEQAFETFGLEYDRVGLATNNSPTGWYGALYAAGAFAHSLGGSSTSGKTSMSNIAYDDFVDAMSKVDKRVHLTGKFYFSSYVADLTRKIKDSALQPLFSPMMAGAPATILGRPWEVCSVLPDITTNATAGMPFALYANLRRALFFGLRHDLEIAFSDHAEFYSGGMGIRLISRFAPKVVLPKAIVIIKNAAS